MSGSTDFDKAYFQDPSKFGFCSFEEFRKQKAKYQPNKEQTFEAIDKGSSQYKIKTYTYYFELYKCESLEQVQRICRERGLTDKDIVFLPERMVDHAGGYECKVRVFSRETLKKRIETYEQQARQEGSA